MRNEILIQDNCVCAGQRLTIICSIVGLGSTVWKGSSFNCQLSGNEISLLHNDFRTNSAEGDCNNGEIMAQGLVILRQDCFRSQLTIVPTLSTNGQTVDCVYDNGAVESAIGQVVVNLTTGLIIIILIVIMRLSLVPGPLL